MNNLWFLAALVLVILYMVLIIFMCRQEIFSRDSKDKVIKVYVDAATYDRLQLMASDLDIPLATFCACCLEAVDPVELEEACRELGIQIPNHNC